MQTDVTRQSFSLIVTQFVLLAALFWASFCYGTTDGQVLPGFGHVPFSINSAGGTIYLPGSFIGDITAPYPVPTVIISLLLIFVNAFIITKTVSQNLVYPIRTYLPCIFYLIIACGICFPAYDLAAVLAAYLMVRASKAFISSFVRTVSFGTTFQGAFFIGLTPLLEPQNAIYILFVPVAMLIFRRCARETIVAFFGALLPTLITAYIWWAVGAGFTGIFVEIWRELSGGIPAIFTSDVLATGAGTFTAFAASPMGIIKLTGIAVILLALILSVFSFFAMSSDMRTRAYKINVFALWFLLFALVSIMLPSRTCGNFTVLAIPAAILGPAFFVRQRNTVPLLLYILIVASIAVANLLPVITQV